MTAERGFSEAWGLTSRTLPPPACHCQCWLPYESTFIGYTAAPFKNKIGRNDLKDQNKSDGWIGEMRYECVTFVEHEGNMKSPGRPQWAGERRLINAPWVGRMGPEETAQLIVSEEVRTRTIGSFAELGAFSLLDRQKFSLWGFLNL